MRRLVLLVLALAACGDVPQTGADRGDAGSQPCVTSASCPVHHCECRNGTGVDDARCSPTAGTCADRVATCTQACIERGGWP